MDVLIRLYDMVHPAADGSIISREVTNKYLASDDYETIIKDRIALGGKTHKDRVATEENRQVIGPDDEVLVKRNSLFYIKKIFTKPDSDFCWAIIHIYDPDNFSGELRDEIINLRAMLKEGTKLPCSVVIQAIWSPSNECLEIIRIKGVDFTLNPSFQGAGTEKLMSMTIVTDEPETKMFSEKAARTGVRLFSMDTEIAEVDNGQFFTEEFFKQKAKEFEEKFDGKDTVSEKDILSKFGRNSDEYKAFSAIRKATDEQVVKKSDLAEILSKLQPADNSFAQEQFLDILKEYVTPDNKQLFVTVFNQGIGKIQQLVNAVPKDDPDYENLIRIRLVNYLNTLPTSDKLFSLSSTVQDRISLYRYPRLIKTRYIFRLYKTFYADNQDKLSSEDKALLERLYLSDWMIFIKEALPAIYDGYNISAYYQLTPLDADLPTLGRNLSFYYRRLLIAEEMLGFIPNTVYTNWSKSLSEFLEKLIIYTFGARLSNQDLSFIK